MLLLLVRPTRLQLAGVHRAPDGDWTAQVARNLTDEADGFLRGKRFLIHDRDPLYTREFRAILAGAGVKTIRLPSHSPNLNAYAERFVRTIRESCLNRIIVFSEAGLRRVLTQFLKHYHCERNHQGLGNRLLFPKQPHDGKTVVRRERLGGLLNYYYRRAA